MPVGYHSSRGSSELTLQLPTQAYVYQVLPCGYVFTFGVTCDKAFGYAYCGISIHRGISVGEW
jgi:hypothetical protein